MADETSLKNQFLVAMPGLGDGVFDRSVTLVCEHNDEGALGLVVNRPTDLHLVAMLDHMAVAHDSLAGDPIVYWGGPMQPERGFVVHDSAAQWQTSLPLADGLYVTTSRDILAALGRGEGPPHYLVVLGYAGWGAGQLDEEMLENVWLSAPVDTSLIFNRPAPERWRAAAGLLGFDISRLASQAGHA
ncbi:MAG TPA: YqgE/AlgH family protein [Nevskiaceae bacterium]|nr:YqgE/AlgH family protein [Nevskiaceae bacterium]